MKKYEKRFGYGIGGVAFFVTTSLFGANPIVSIETFDLHLFSGNTVTVEVDPAIVTVSLPPPPPPPPPPPIVIIECGCY